MKTLHNLKKLDLFNFFAILSIILIIATAVFEPFSYPIGYMMIGRGRFADFYDTFMAAGKYPDMGAYCVAP